MVEATEVAELWPVPIAVTGEWSATDQFGGGLSLSVQVHTIERSKAEERSEVGGM
jgi:hypothetical protein